MFLSRKVWVFLLAVAAGTGLHFLYDAVPSIATAVIAPVNESIWEHIKLLYWPALAGGLVLERWEKNWGARCTGILLGAFLMQVGGWFYHGPLGGDMLWVDILLYLAVMAVAFLVPAVWKAPKGWTPWLTAAVIVLGGAIIWFTIHPPVGISIFREGG